MNTKTTVVLLAAVFILAAVFLQRIQPETVFFVPVRNTNIKPSTPVCVISSSQSFVCDGGCLPRIFVEYQKTKADDER